ncbi:hypothetical protein C1T17_02530 [Sphingobium sp. SCG-1]|nr:hypothetical protein C1T17_02530 [Sphingobium sp. SCG-1]
MAVLIKLRLRVLSGWFSAEFSAMLSPMDMPTKSHWSQSQGRRADRPNLQSGKSLIISERRLAETSQIIANIATARWQDRPEWIPTRHRAAKTRDENRRRSVALAFDVQTSALRFCDVRS